MSKFPHEMTDAEIRALPVGPFKTVDESLTHEDRSNGMCGMLKRRVLKTNGVALGLDSACIWADPSTGEHFSFGQWDTGEWYRQIFD